MRTQRRLWPAVVALTGLALGTACGTAQPGAYGAGGSSGAAASGGQTAALGQARKLGDFTFADYGTKDARGQAQLAIKTDSYYFEPTFVQGAPSQKIKLMLTNASSTMHNLSVA